MKRLFAILLSATLALSLAACGGESTPADSSASGESTDSSAEPIRIGVMNCFTGGMAAYGEHEMRGIELAHEQFPEVNGRPIELVIADNKSDPVESANAAQRLIESENCSIILGSYGSAMCMAAGETVKNGEVPTITAGATNANITLGNPYYYRACFLDSLQTPLCAQYCYNEQNYTTAGLIYEITNDACVAQSQFFKDEFTRLGGTIVGEASYSLGDQDFSSQLLAVAGQNPDVIFISGAAADEALAIQQARTMGYVDVPFISTDGVDLPEFTEIGGDAVKGTVCSTHFDAAAEMSSKTASFVEDFEAKYGSTPAAYSALAYDTYLIAYEALKQADSYDGPTLKGVLDSIEVEGVTGTISFDENGDAKKNSVVLKIVGDNGWEFLEILSGEGQCTQ